MTTHASHVVWQDVYRPVTRRGAAYVKVTVYPQENLIVVSFNLFSSVDACKIAVTRVLAVVYS